MELPSYEKLAELVDDITEHDSPSVEQQTPMTKALKLLLIDDDLARVSGAGVSYTDDRVVTTNPFVINE